MIIFLKYELSYQPNLHQLHVLLFQKGMYDFRYTGVMTDSEIPSDQVRL